MTGDLIRVGMQLPFGDAAQFAAHGPGWSQIWIRPDTSDEDVLREIWIEDVYRVRGIDLAPVPDVTHPLVKPVLTTVIDLGACTGIFSALCLTFGASRVFAVEMNAENVELLNRNLPSDRVTVWRAAITGDSSDMFAIGDGATGHTSTVPSEGDLIHRMVKGVKVEEIISQVSGRVPLLKCDIEGAEYDAFLACPSDVLMKVERIAMEWHGPSEAPWLERQRIGELVQHLQATHSCTLIGKPASGGYLFAHRNDL